MNSVERGGETMSLAYQRGRRIGPPTFTYLIMTGRYFRMGSARVICDANGGGNMQIQWKLRTNAHKFTSGVPIFRGSVQNAVEHLPVKQLDGGRPRDDFNGIGRICVNRGQTIVELLPTTHVGMTKDGQP